MPDIQSKDNDEKLEGSDEKANESRLNLRLTPEARETLEWISTQRHVSFAEVIRRALGTEKFLIEVSSKKGRILVDTPGENTKELVLI